MAEDAVAKILLIEDDVLVASAVETVLRKAGHAVLVAPNGAIGLQTLDAENPDLVITDIIMPEKEGIETIREIRARNLNVPIIAYSGGGSRKNYDFLQMALNLGADEAIRKPFANEDLLAMVKRVLEDRID